MMTESRDKGIIQRVIDNIYEKFNNKPELKQNCDLRVSFLEIYKEQVTDLLEGHDQPRKRRLSNKPKDRNHSTSFAIYASKKEE